MHYDTYQWLLNGKLIPNATDSTYIVSENGDYQVIVSDGNCIDTSDIYKVMNVGIDKLYSLADQIQVYPNPAKDVVYIDAPVAITIALYSIEGKLIKKEHNIRKINVSDVAEGVYILKIFGQKEQLLKLKKIVK